MDPHLGLKVYLEGKEIKEKTMVQILEVGIQYSRRSTHTIALLKTTMTQVSRMARQIANSCTGMRTHFEAGAPHGSEQGDIRSGLPVIIRKAYARH